MWLNTSQASQILHRCEEQVRRMARDGKIRSYRPQGTRKIYFKSEDIDEYINAGLIPSQLEIINKRIK